MRCFPQREYLERCDDRKSYNYLVGISSSIALPSSCSLSVGLNNRISLHICTTIIMTLLKSYSHSIGFVVLLSCIIYTNISDIGYRSPIHPYLFSSNLKRFERSISNENHVWKNIMSNRGRALTTGNKKKVFLPWSECTDHHRATRKWLKESSREWEAPSSLE